MTPFGFGRYALGAAAMGAMLSGCSGSGSSGPLPAGREAGPSAGHRIGGRSWADAGANQQDLLYVTNSNGLVDIFRYWKHELVGVLTDFTSPLGECADRSGNVYIVDNGAQSILEYAHGGTKAIATIIDKGYEPHGCAVDPTTGNLAVANYSSTEYTGYADTGNIAIYAHGAGTPKYYGSDDGRFTNLAYDDRGNLLVTALNYFYYSSTPTTLFYYLPHHGKSLLSMNLPNDSFYYGWPQVSSINYDGTYWVAATGGNLYRYTINIKAQEVDEIQLSGAKDEMGEIALYRKTPKAQATEAVAGAGFVGYWQYPAGGDAYFEITSYLDYPYGVAISLRK
jgi:hypothetical protein